MKRIFVLSICLSVIIGCKDSLQSGKYFSEVQSEYLNKIQALSPNEVASLDASLAIFNEYKTQMRSPDQVDSLFFPDFWQTYFKFGSSALLHVDQSLLDKYGFKKVEAFNSFRMIPVKSELLNKNVIPYLSKGMQEFTNQQIEEFGYEVNLEKMAHSTLWWDNFMAKYPDFKLQEILDFHFENWHLKRLIAGTDEVPIFGSDGILREEIKAKYLEIVKENPKSVTGKELKEYLQILENNNYQLTNEVVAFQVKFESGSH